MASVAPRPVGARSCAACCSSTRCARRRRSARATSTRSAPSSSRRQATSLAAVARAGPPRSGSSPRRSAATVIRVQIATSADVSGVRVRLDGRSVSLLANGRSPLTLILRNFSGRGARGRGADDQRRCASPPRPPASAAPRPATPHVRAQRLERRRRDGRRGALAAVPHDTRFQLVGGGTDMGIADAARGIVDAGLVDRPLRPGDPPGLPSPRSRPAPAFVTRGAPRGRSIESCAGSHVRDPDG